MMKVIRVMIGLGAGLGILVFSALPSFASTVTVSGNGADSNNTVNVQTSNQVSISQSNQANINNNVSVESNTGGNQANKNTGGDVSITTGNASSNVSITNNANQNQLNLGSECFCFLGGNFDVKISGNGADSHNQVNFHANNHFSVNQRNNAHVNNNVNIHNNTGFNQANKNTGENSDPSIDTGSASSWVNIMNNLNSNMFSF